MWPRRHASSRLTEATVTPTRRLTDIDRAGVAAVKAYRRGMRQAHTGRCLHGKQVVRAQGHDTTTASQSRQGRLADEHYPLRPPPSWRSQPAPGSPSPHRLSLDGQCLARGAGGADRLRDQCDGRAHVGARPAMLDVTTTAATQTETSHAHPRDHDTIRVLPLPGQARAGALMVARSG
jgi:hypothetical protein